jgi:hypothetical protein
MQVEAELSGWLADACTEIEVIEETVISGERRIVLEPMTVRPVDLSCAQASTEYRLTTRLDVSGFAEGDYVVQAGDRQASFTIEPMGDFPMLSLPAVDSESRLIVPAAGLLLIPPTEWSRDGLVWESPSYLSARIGLRWHEPGRNPVELLPSDTELHESSESRLGWATGLRFRVSGGAAGRWSEHLYVSCSETALCEFWMDAPTEPLLEAAGEAFWRMVRFVVRQPA